MRISSFIKSLLEIVGTFGSVKLVTENSNYEILVLWLKRLLWWPKHSSVVPSMNRKEWDYNSISRVPITEEISICEMYNHGLCFTRNNSGGEFFFRKFELDVPLAIRLNSSSLLQPQQTLINPIIFLPRNIFSLIYCISQKSSEKGEFSIIYWLVVGKMIWTSRSSFTEFPFDVFWQGDEPWKPLTLMLTF